MRGRLLKATHDEDLSFLQHYFVGQPHREALKCLSYPGSPRFPLRFHFRCAFRPRLTHNSLSLCYEIRWLLSQNTRLQLLRTEDKRALAWLQGALRGSQMMLFLKALGKGNKELQLFASFCCDKTMHSRPNGFQQVMWCGGGIAEVA